MRYPQRAWKLNATIVAVLAIAALFGIVLPSNAAPLPARSIAQPPPYTYIHTVQGAGHLSPLAGGTVTDVYGIVTVALSNRFYMQTPDALVDGDDATSEGILVFRGSPPGVSVGDEVIVDATVTEFYPGGFGANGLSITELTSITDITILSSGNPVPSPTVVGVGGRVPPSMVIEDDATGDVNTTGVFDPASDGIDFYESLEGMILQVNDAVAVGPTNNFGEIPIVGDNGANASVRSNRGGVVIRSNDYNPERIITDDVIVTNEPKVNTGDKFAAPVLGVLDYSFGNFKLLNYAALPAVNAGGLAAETTKAPTQSQYLVATFNVENLNPGVNAAKLSGLASQIVNNMRAPAIIGLQEMQDNNGGTDNGVVAGNQTFEALIAAIQTAGGPVYDYRQIDPVNNADGGAPGSNIRVGFLFRPDLVTFVDRPGGDATTATNILMAADGPYLSISPGRIDPSNSAWDDSRKSIAAEFLIQGHKFFVIVNHLKSKTEDGALFGRIQPPVLATEAQRIAQAQVLNNFVDGILTQDPKANIIMLGDLNEFQFASALSTLKAGGVLTNLIDKLPTAEQYSYIFDGNSEVLDHILISSNVNTQFYKSVDVVHTNAEFSMTNRPSDHDAVVANLQVDTWRFRGYTYRGYPRDTTDPLPGVMMSLYGRNTGDPSPGTLIDSKASDASGFWNFFLNSRMYDTYTVMATPPAGLVGAGVWSSDGNVISPESVEWSQPAPGVHSNEFYFEIPTPTPTPTDTPTPTPTDTPTPTPTNTPTATVVPETPTHTPTITPSPTPYRLWLPLVMRKPLSLGDTVLELTILHNNDGESQLLSAGSGLADYGGIARFATLMKQLEAQAQAASTSDAAKAVLKIEAGDNFLAGPEWNASLSKGVPYYDAIGQDYLNYDVISLGNHDFDFGPDITANFLESFQTGGEVFVAANADFSQEPRLQALVNSGRLMKSTIVEKSGFKIGVIGLMPPESPFITTLRNVTIDPDTVQVVQEQIDELTAQGVGIIVLSTQLQSIRNDLALIPQLRGLDVIVSGGGDEVLGDPEDDLYVPGDESNIFGTYPLYGIDKDGASVPVVTTSGDYKYVGKLVVGFDAKGQLTMVDDAASKMVRVAGDALPDAVAPDAYVQTNVTDPVAAYVQGLSQTVIGQSNVALEGRRPQIRIEETNEGDLMADALLWQAAQQAADYGVPVPDVALQNGGGIRNNSLIPAGNVTELTTFDIAPFLNFLAVVPDVTPEQLKLLLENGYSRIEFVDGRFAQIAGMRVVVDKSKPGMTRAPDGAILTPGERVRSVILDDGTVMVEDGQIAPTARNVTVASIDFLTRGGDQYPFPSAGVRLGATYQQALRNFIVDGLKGEITASRYPTNGAGRIIYPTATYNLTVLHNNDGESKLLNAGTGALADFGGIARFATLMVNLQQAASGNVLKVAAGDNFLAGAQWNASLDKGVPYYDAIAQDYINYDVIDLGNHDFDFGPDVTANFIESFQPGGETFVAANLDFSGEPRLQALVDEDRLTSSVIVEKGGRKIGVIGVVPPDLPFLSTPRNVTVTDTDTAAVVQAEVDKLTAQGVNIIVLATQLQTINNDIALVEKVSGLDIVISGGGDEVLGDPGDLYVPGDETNIFGTYPLYATAPNGARVPVVTTAGDYKYVGQLVVGFDNRGVLVTLDDTASKMVRVAGGSAPDAVPSDAFVQANVVDPVAAYVNGLAQNIVGQSEVALEGRRPQIRNQETNEGNLFADALLWQAQQQAADFGAPMPEVALQNGGGIRNNSIIPAGDISELTTYNMAAFSNFVAIVHEVTPQQLKDSLENGYSRIESADGRFAHIAGMKVVVDLGKQGMVIDANGNLVTPGERVQSIILDDGTVIVENGVIAPTARNVNVATIDFLVVQKGDQYIFWPSTFTRLGATYQQALRDYIKIGLNGDITAADYPEGGEGRITQIPASAQ